MQRAGDEHQQGDVAGEHRQDPGGAQLAEVAQLVGPRLEMVPRYGREPVEGDRAERPKETGETEKKLEELFGLDRPSERLCFPQKPRGPLAFGVARRGSVVDGGGGLDRLPRFCHTQTVRISTHSVKLKTVALETLDQLWRTALASGRCSTRKKTCWRRATEQGANGCIPLTLPPVRCRRGWCDASPGVRPRDRRGSPRGCTSGCPTSGRRGDASDAGRRTGPVLPRPSARR